MLKTSKDMPIGAIFEIAGIQYQIEEGLHCRDCCFMDSVDTNCMDKYNTGLPSCSGMARNDGKSIIFKIVGKVES